MWDTPAERNAWAAAGPCQHYHFHLNLSIFEELSEITEVISGTNGEKVELNIHDIYRQAHVRKYVSTQDVLS